ncbi:carbon storage regulator CsrA [Paenibacillus sacheonensis]|uniref:Translational regulator CsrA n=1 Tax=Paenibacillus sacheonensis TaxID=742054 RepID=A0A7X5C5A1_9BACL|nr:carbon storage regulator CsrA [Paenibacillus sacheonensis]MBM7566476.1 carbon storage regulator [Paenibacillus sacheonensis]NBC73159.1 carbon storage regulator CsrA [Paenibacillus sacheonensis]
MLVLSRKKGETIMIGNDIELTVLEVTPDGVKLGISAPKEIGILRKELFAATATTNKDALHSLDALQSLQIRYKEIKNKETRK